MGYVSPVDSEAPTRNSTHANTARLADVRNETIEYCRLLAISSVTAKSCRWAFLKGAVTLSTGVPGFGGHVLDSERTCRWQAWRRTRTTIAVANAVYDAASAKGQARRHPHPALRVHFVAKWLTRGPFLCWFEFVVSTRCSLGERLGLRISYAPSAAA